MSASQSAGTHRHLGDHARVAALVAAPLVLPLLVVGVARADLPAGVTRLSAEEADRGESAVRLVPHTVHGATLVEVEPGADGLSLLAVSADGSQAALADRLGEPTGVLTIARADGSQLRATLPGLLSSAFVAGDAWLAVIDGRGGLWRVDPTSGRATALADGPFLGAPVAAGDGSLLLLSVPSVEAPYWSRLVRVATSTGVATAVSDADLVYAAFPLDDGSLALVAHEPGRTVVRRLSRTAESVLADLGPGAVNVSVAADARHIAFERDGDGILVVDAPGGPSRRLGDGSRPCFAPDGSVLLLRRGTAAVAVALDGSVLAVVEGQARFAGNMGCPS